MSYEDTLRALGSNTQNMVASVHAQWTRGEITKRTMGQLVKTLVLTANTQGAAFGALSFQAFMDVSTGAALPVSAGLNVLTPGEIKKTQSAINAVLALPREQQVLAFERLSFNAPIRSATESFRRGMVSDKRVPTYTRGLEADACQLCQWLYKDGYEYRASKPMHRHPGCVCSQIPTIQGV